MGINCVVVVVVMIVAVRMGVGVCMIVGVLRFQATHAGAEGIT